MSRPSPRPPGRPGGERGTSLVEALVATTLAMLVGAAAIALLHAQAAVARSVQAELAAVSAASWALDVALRDVALAGADPMRAGIPGLRSAGDDAIEIDADLDGSGSIDGASAERRGLSWSSGSGGRILRRLGNQSTALAAPVTTGGFRVRLRDADGATVGSGVLDAAALSRARQAELEVAVSGAPERPEMQVRLVSRAALRSRLPRRSSP